MRRIRLFALVVAVSAAILPAVSARAGDPVTLYGSGWGHGLGLSQWGAYGLASDGWTSTQILTHFYSGTQVSKIAQPPADIRVALATAEPALHLTAEAGPVRLSVQRPVGGTLVGRIPDGETWVVRSVDGAYEVHDADGAVVGGTTWGSASSNLYATYADHGARVTVPEGGATYNRGTLEFNLTACANGCSLRLIARLPFEDYLLGDRRGAEQLAQRGAAGAGRRGAELRALQDPEVRPAADLQLPSHRRLERPGLHRVGQGGRARRPTVGQGGAFDHGVGRDVQGRRRVDGVHGVRRRAHRGPQRAVGDPARRVPVPGGGLRPG